ncbi:FG-GAP repeat protein [Planctomycetes bacterium Poly30]|uniref:FG-GAP repeat protein n=2 Tax=Saltatorellus ferox TaxID=2528018 RepID=A0A518EPH1_9BACT|nr:FG-GAP repeat protein [Planctomycetes bacterium Poly30]
MTAAFQALLLCTTAWGAQSGTIQTTDVFEVSGSGPLDSFGARVSPAGDVNQDGHADVMAASLAGALGTGSPTYVRVLSGRDGSVLHELRGQSSAETHFGAALDAAGDLDGDGFPDLLVGSPNPDPTAPIFGSVYAFSGADGSLIHRWVEAQINEDFGRAVSGVGDVNGDGRDDIVIGSPRAANSRGFARIYSGATGQPIRTYFGVGGERLGAAVSEFGDLDGDGVPDVLVGSPDGLLGSCPSCVRVFSGFDGAPLLTLTDGDPLSRLGAAVAPAGDFDGDGILDILAGAPDASILEPKDGAAYIFSGADGTVLRRWSDRAGLPLPSGFGSSIGSGGDIDGDGLPDFVVGAPTAKGAANGLARGALYGYSGFDGRRLFRITGAADRDGLGSGACIIGDANGDGFANFAAGASLASGTSLISGKVRVFRRVAANGGVLCLGQLNSSGVGSVLEAWSQSGYSAVANDVALEVTQLPPNVLGYFLVSPDFNIAAGVGGGVGTLCIASTNIGRYSASIGISSSSGELGFLLDNTSIPLPSAGGAGAVAAKPGETFNFQFWHRDAGPGGAPTSNLSGAVTITFL